MKTDSIRPSKQIQEAQKLGLGSDEILESISDAFYAVDVNWRLTYINHRAEDWFKRNREELLGTVIWDILPEAEETVCWQMHKKSACEHVHVHWEMLFPNSQSWVEVNAYPISDGGLAVYFHDITDITERKVKEEELYQLNRTMRAISNSNQALMHVTDEALFLQEVCRIITEDCGHAMVWIGYAEDDEKRSVRPVAYAGFEEGYLETLQITWADTDRGRGPTGLSH